MTIRKSILLIALSILLLARVPSFGANIIVDQPDYFSLTATDSSPQSAILTDDWEFKRSLNLAVLPFKLSLDRHPDLWTAHAPLEPKAPQKAEMGYLYSRGRFVKTIAWDSWFPAHPKRHL